MATGNNQAVAFGNSNFTANEDLDLKEKNPLFKRLKRLFSTDIIIRNQGGETIKVLDLDHLQASGIVQTNLTKNTFTGVYTGGLGTYLGTSPYSNYILLRPDLYNDYEVMSQDPIISSALNVVADECTLKNDRDEILSIKSSNNEIQEILYNLFYDILNINFNLRIWIHTMAKFGDCFLHLHIGDNKVGVFNATPISCYNISREEGFSNGKDQYIDFKVGINQAFSGIDYTRGNQQVKRTTINTLQNYEVANFRLLSDYNFLPYGTSYLEGARKIYKQLNLMEDAMLIHRIVRAPQRRVYYVNVGNLPPNEIENSMQKLKTSLGREPYIDHQTGQYNLRFNMVDLDKDLYIPVRGSDNKNTRVETLPGLEYNAIEDVKYLRDKMFAALKIPKAFIGYEGEVQGKSTLSQQDIRFARTIENIQRIVISELEKIAIVHLYAKGIKEEDILNFELKLTTPSIIYEQERISLLKEKVSLASDMMNNKLLSTDYIYKNIFNLSIDEYEIERELLVNDKERMHRLNQIENEGNDPDESGMSYGTPSQLALAYNDRRNGGKLEIKGYDETKPGRPEDDSIYDTNKRILGRDPLDKQQDIYPEPAYDQQTKRIIEERINTKFNQKNKREKLLESLRKKFK